MGKGRRRGKEEKTCKAAFIPMTVELLLASKAGRLERG